MQLTDREVQRLLLENARLRANNIPHCRGCKRLKLHPCGAWHYCPILGPVDPDIDGCSKRSAAQ